MTNAHEVCQYLADHPDFFVDHPQLLESLHVPHIGEGNTISLVERQVKVLRERQAASRERLAELVRNARHNEQLAARIHKLTLRLLHARTTMDVHTQVTRSMTEDFDIQIMKLLDSNDALREWLSSGKPRCGHFSLSQRQSVFGESMAEQIGSMALIPIGLSADHGVLAVASTDTTRFAPGISTDFLEHVGELLAATLDRTHTASSDHSDPS